MNRIIYLLVMLLLSDILFDWYTNKQKIEAVRQISANNEQLQEQIEVVSQVLNQIRKEMRDDEAWLKTIKLLENNSIK